MKITKYIKKNNGIYQLLFDNNTRLDLYEDVIFKYNLLYKSDIDMELFNTLLKDNNKYTVYNKCIKYIGIRLRSINEIREYLKRNHVDIETSNLIIEKLLSNRLLDDSLFTKAFINDKLKFTTMGPYKIEYELNKHKIDKNIIYKYINLIDKNVIDEKLDKEIIKLIKLNKNKKNNRNRIYNRLISLGYSSDTIVNNLNKYNL